MQGRSLKHAAPPFSDTLFLDKITMVFIVAFCFPMVTCVWLSFNQSMIYWVGRSGQLAILALPWMLLGRHFMENSHARLVNVVLVSLLPVVAVLLLARTHLQWATDAQTKLQTQDCSTFQRKVRLQSAWNAADQALSSCVDFRMNTTDAPTRSEVERLTDASQCDAYVAGLPKWGAEWEYLSSLERSQGCAGWCEPGRALWTLGAEDRLRDRCSIVAGDIMGGVSGWTRQITYYSVALLVVAGLTISAQASTGASM